MILLNFLGLRSRRGVINLVVLPTNPNHPVTKSCNRTNHGENSVSLHLALLRLRVVGRVSLRLRWCLFQRRVDSSYVTTPACPAYPSDQPCAEPFIRHFGERQDDGTWGITPSQLSLMTSMINVGELVGSLGAATLNDFFGRKGVFLIGSLCIALGVALQLAASNPPLMIAGRVILGLGVGNFSATSPLYMGVSYRMISQFFERGVVRRELTVDPRKLLRNRCDRHFLCAGN
jgi:hypothetical protein